MTNNISVTKEAKEEYNKIAGKARNSESTMLRIVLAGLGWGGPRFRLTLDELKNEDDIVEELDGIKIVYKSNYERFLKGSVIKYSNSWFRKGLTIDIGRAC